MKIRLQTGSVRFRLRQSEVKNLIATGHAVEILTLSHGTLENLLELGDGPPEVILLGAGLVTRIPAVDVRRWAEGCDVGLRYTLPTGTQLLVEKDWACLEPTPGESNEDTFARPGSAAALVPGSKAVPSRSNS